MDRRELLKSMSLALGYTFTPVALTALVSSCSKEASVNWKPLFFSSDEALALEKLADVFLPRTDIPGAVDVGAHIFTDLFLAKAAKDKDQTKYKKAAAVYVQAFEANLGKPIGSASGKDFTDSLSSYFSIDGKEQDLVKNLIGKEKPDAREEEKYYIYSFLFKVKEYVMWGYYASEEIGENVLTYLPVPGKFEGCIPLSEVGNAYSL